MKQEGINVGSILVWGAGNSLRLDPVQFRGQEDDQVSEPNYIVHWDIEISALPGDWHGHMDLLNVAQKDAVVPNQVNYPGQDYLLPNYQYVQSQGGIVGYGHGNVWLPGSYSAQQAGPRELPLDVTLAKVDFLAAELINEGLYWLWYSMLNAGFHFPLLGTSDLGCVWPTVGRYHAAFPLPKGDTLTYTKFIEAVREGRTVIRSNAFLAPDYLDIRVNGMGLGGELILPNQATTVNVQVDASSVVSGQTVELILDGNVIGSQALTNSLQTYQWSVPLNRSGWIAAKTTAAHTAATFVLLGGCPIRNDPVAARNWKGYLDAYYEAGVFRGRFGTSAAEVRQKVDEAKQVWERIAQEGEGSIAMDCNAGTQDFTINAAISDAWFFSDTAGQGFFIIVWEDSKLVFMAWFTYDTERPPEDVMAILGEPGQRWLTALGPYEGNTALLDIFLSSGMVFDSAEPPVTTEQLEGATIEIVWTDCKKGLVKYNILTLGLMGEIPIQRVVEDKVAACEAAQAQSASRTGVLWAIEWPGKLAPKYSPSEVHAFDYDLPKFSNGSTAAIQDFKKRPSAFKLRSQLIDATHWLNRSAGVSKSREDSNAIDSDQSDNSATQAGAAYVFTRSGMT